jgi:hypothetical protein
MGPSITSPENLNLPHTHFIWDCHHLKTDVWPKEFGGHFRDTLSNGLTEMLNSNSEEEFNGALKSIETAYAGNSDILNKVHRIAEEKDHYAKYIVENVPGTAGKRSNNPSEITNSSVIAHLGGALYEHPHVEIKNLLVRQHDLETKRQQEKSEYKLKVQAEIVRCPELVADEQLRNAILQLDKKPFECWREDYHLSKDYRKNVTEAGVEILHKSYPEKVGIYQHKQISPFLYVREWSVTQETLKHIFLIVRLVLVRR